MIVVTIMRVASNALIGAGIGMDTGTVRATGDMAMPVAAAMALIDAAKGAIGMGIVIIGMGIITRARIMVTATVA